LLQGFLLVIASEAWQPLSFKITSSLTLLALTVTQVFFSGLNLTKRIWEHKNKLVQGVTEKYSVDKLVYYEQFEDAEYSIRREKNLSFPNQVGE